MSDRLEAERKKAGFDTQELKYYLRDGEENYKRHKAVADIIVSDPILKNDPSKIGVDRRELIELSSKKGKRLHELFGLVDQGDIIVQFVNHFADIIPYGVSTYMFLPYIQYLGTDKQFEKWYPRIRSMEVIGTYAQTELGHGSDVRSLETTITYDKKTDEFVINSPTLTSTKWWPGEIGLTSNHAVVMGQLILEGENLGVHGFIVQTRDLETNKPLKGMTIGDIGPKSGWNAKDNGFLRFDNVRIPRENMLMRYSKITKEGKYTRRGNEKIGYAVMMKIRDMISHGSYTYLAQALTIAIRYSILRSQFHDDEGNEIPVLNYQTQQNKLLTLLATTFAMNAGAHKATKMVQQNIANIEKNEDFSMMADVHAILSGTKSFYSEECHYGVTISRWSCGGHGYSSYSGFSGIDVMQNPQPTFEGENTVMALQTARYLVKCLQKLQKNKEISENVDYLTKLNEILSISRCGARRADDFDNNLVFDLVKVNAAYLVYVAGKNLAKKGAEVGFKAAWDTKVGINLIEAARAHIVQYTFRSFFNNLNNIKCPKLKGALSNLCTLYGIEQLLKHPLGLIESGYIESKQFTMLRERKEELLTLIRPYALNLVEGFDIPDNSLKTAIGARDGKPYETLWEWVNKYNEFNKIDWTKHWEEDIKALRKITPKPKL